MKKRLTILFSILALVCGIAYGAGIKPYAFPFIGRWQPAEDPLLIDDYGFQDIQNLRKDGKRLKGVSGHTKINTAVWDATYSYPKNGYHFAKDIPASESHVLITAADSAGANARLYRNTTAIPDQGAFSATLIHTDSSTAGLGRFSAAPQGNIIYSNGSELKIWGGSEQYAVSFITSASTLVYTATSAKDYSEEVSNAQTTNDQVAVIGGGNDSDTTVLVHYDGADSDTGNYTSEDSNAHTVVHNGTAQLDIDFAKFGTSSVLFDGNSDYDSISDSDGVNDWFNMGAGDYTLDLWVRFNSLPSNGQGMGIYSQRDDADNYMKAWIYYSSPNYQLHINLENGGGIPTVLSNANVSITTNVWYHIATTKSGTTYTTYLDGVSVATWAGATTWGDMAGDFEIGRHYDETGTEYEYLDGRVDEVRLSTGIVRWPADFTPPVRAYFSPARTWLVGYYRPLQGVKYYVQDANGIASVMTTKEWQGNSWVTLTAAANSWVDNTDTGASLATTGTVTWTNTGLGEVRYIEGLSLYWYQFTIDAGDATIYQVTVDAPFGNVRNVWDGSEIVVASAKLFEDSTYKEYTDYVNDDTETTVMVLDSLVAGTEYLTLGFTQPVQGVNIKFYPGRENVDATVLTVNHWDGAAWASVKALSDGTDEPTGDSFGKTGVITWQPVPVGSEFKRAISDQTPLYYYQFKWSVALDAEVEIYQITGIPAPKPLLPDYDFATLYQTRTFLFKDNFTRYSAYNLPDVYNGSDSGYIYFGSDEKITSAAVIYNVFQTTGYEQLLVTKANETYRITGDSPSNWVLTQMSGNIGNVAPLSMAVCEIADLAEGVKRHVAIWQTGHGVVMSDGATIQPISDDIANYWDPNHADYIPADRQDDSVGWYDPTLKSYKLLISSGPGQTTHNVELEYSLRNQEWTKIYRENSSGANPLQVGFQVRDTTGNTYTYGATNEGTMYRLENGKTWAGTPIDQYVHTKDLMLDDQIPLMRDSIVTYFRLMLEEKATGDGEDISVVHYCDGSTTATVDGTEEQVVPDDIDMADGRIDTQDCLLGPCLSHSFKIQASNVSTVFDGMEVLGLGLYFEPQNTIRTTR